MPSATYFVQGCPTCGRRLQIRIEYLGKRVACQHCRGTFTAADPSGSQGNALRRANELLESMAQRNSSAQSRANR